MTARSSELIDRMSVMLVSHGFSLREISELWDIFAELSNIAFKNLLGRGSASQVEGGEDMKTKHGKVEGKIVSSQVINGVRYRLVERPTGTTAYRQDPESKVWVYVGPRRSLKAFEEETKAE